MAIQQPGTSSTISFLVSSVLSIILLLAIITGHLVLAIYLWFHFSDGSGMEVIRNYTGIPDKFLWLSIGIAFLMDMWIMIHTRKGHQKLKAR